MGRGDGDVARLDFLVMEYLEGETLEQQLKRSALPLDQALQLVIQIADTVGAPQLALSPDGRPIVFVGGRTKIPYQHAFLGSRPITSSRATDGVYFSPL